MALYVWCVVLYGSGGLDVCRDTRVDRFECLGEGVGDVLIWACLGAGLCACIYDA